MLSMMYIVASASVTVRKQSHHLTVRYLQSRPDRNDRGLIYPVTTASAIIIGMQAVREIYQLRIERPIRNHRFRAPIR